MTTSLFWLVTGVTLILLVVAVIDYAVCALAGRISRREESFDE